MAHVVNPLKFPMIACSPLKARSEFAKSRPDGGAGVAGPFGAAAGLGFAFPSGRSAGVGLPRGDFGSKKPSGFGRFLMSSMLRAATPASLYPGLSLTRG